LFCFTSTCYGIDMSTLNKYSCVKNEKKTLEKE
jgi:hypothetical protein